MVIFIIQFICRRRYSRSLYLYVIVYDYIQVLIKKRQGRMVDALVQNGDEGRGKLR